MLVRLGGFSMSGNHHKNGARNQMRETFKPNLFGRLEPVVVEAKWFANRRKRNRVRDRIAKLARRRNRK